MTIIENILARHCGLPRVQPGEIVDIKIDVRLARDFGGANVIRNLNDYGLPIDDPRKTYFTLDCNPTGSDQQYAANQQKCRVFARDHNIRVYDINAGIGTHLAIDEGLAIPGDTLVSTDSHANLLGSIGCFGQGMGDRDIAAAWAKGSVWFRVPETVRIMLKGNRPEGLTAKDIALNLLKFFGAHTLLGFAVEIHGNSATSLTLDERITISSMATEMGAIIIFFEPSEEIICYCSKRSGSRIPVVKADNDARYERDYVLDISEFLPVVSKPGHPEDVVPLEEVSGKRVHSVFIGSCTNGRMEDLHLAAGILQGRKIAPGIVLKIVPSTDEIWRNALEEGLIKIFKDAGALVSNAGCAGCASGQVGQNGPGEVTVSTGNRNFSGKQGKGEVYLASPAIAAASALAGCITRPGKEHLVPAGIESEPAPGRRTDNLQTVEEKRPFILEGKVWIIDIDNIDTDMIYHNRHLAVTDPEEMGRYTFGNLKGWEDYPLKTEPGDIIMTSRNFGAGSSRQQAVDCFKTLENQAIVAFSFGAIYERNAINSGFPVIACENWPSLGLRQRDFIRIDLVKGIIQNPENGREVTIRPLSEVQMKIYMAGDLLKVSE